MGVSAQTGRVLSVVDGLQQELIDTLGELIRIRSVNPRYSGVNFDEEIGGETRANTFLAGKYRELGLQVDLWEEVPGRANLAGVWRGTGGGKSLIHNGHIDTVPPGLADNWTSGDPFSGKVLGGRVYGRGTCDMKGPLVCQMMAIKAIQQAGVRLKGDVILEATAGEENMDGATIGAGCTVKRGYRADAAIISEPSGPPYPLAIDPVSPGLWWVSVTVEGKASHASMRGPSIHPGGLGSNVAVSAIDKGILVMGAIRELEKQWASTKKHPLFNPGHFSMLPGVITGAPHGVQVPFFIPDYCVIEYCIWYHPDEEPEAVKREFEACVSRAAQADDWLRQHPPRIDWKVNWPAAAVPEDHPICRTVAAAHEEAAAGTRFAGPVKFCGFSAVSDATFLNQQGIPSIIYGPGDLRVAHAPDEYVEIDELMVATKTYALATMDWCGVSDH